jgi:hypothetical protein
MKFLLIGYSIRIKNIYNEIEPRLTPLVFTTLHHKEPDRIVQWVYPHAERAFQTGVEFGNFVKKRDRKHELMGRDKKRLFSRYITAVKTAHQVFKLKTDRTATEGTPKYDLMFSEYVSTVSKATDRLIIDAGQYGFRKSVK